MTRWIVALAVAVVACKDEARPKLGQHDEEPAKFVDQLVPGDHGSVLRVEGTVEGPIETSGSGDDRTVLFTLTHGPARLRVLHRGVLPVRFAPGSETAAVGRYLEADRAAVALPAYGFGSAAPGDVLVAGKVLSYGPSF